MTLEDLTLIDLPEDEYYNSLAFDLMSVMVAKQEIKNGITFSNEECYSVNKLESELFRLFCEYLGIDNMTLELYVVKIEDVIYMISNNKNIYYCEDDTDNNFRAFNANFHFHQINAGYSQWVKEHEFLDSYNEN